MRNWIFLTFSLLCSFVFAGCATSPISGEQQLMFISEQQDIAIGRRYAPEVERQMGGKIPNDQLQNYVNSVGQRIAGVSQRPEWEYRFAALDDESVNAFVLPGGYVFITKGMLRELSTEAQLAAILAHETVHVVARHAAAQMSREIGIEILLSAVTSEKTPSGLLTAAGLARQIIGLGYSREQELEADLAGLDYMLKAGYNPYGMVETMQMLQRKNALRPLEFFSTHPNPANRMARITGRIRRSYSGISALKVGAEDYERYVLAKLD